MTEDHLRILSMSNIFYGLSLGEIEEVLKNRVFRIKHYEKGALIVQAGSPCDHLTVILDGKVSGEMMDLSGKILKIEDMEPSKMIAPAFLYGMKRIYPVNVVASEDTSLWLMHRDDFSKLMQSELKLLNNFLNAISNRAQFLSDKIRLLSFPTLRAKLAFFLLKNSGGEEVFRLTMTHQQLSELFGVTRPSLSREISLMNNEGLIESERDMIKIKDLKRMKALLHEN